MQSDLILNPINSSSDRCVRMNAFEISRHRSPFLIACTKELKLCIIWLHIAFNGIKNFTTNILLNEVFVHLDVCFRASGNLIPFQDQKVCVL